MNKDDFKEITSTKNTNFDIFYKDFVGRMRSVLELFPVGLGKQRLLLEYKKEYPRDTDDVNYKAKGFKDFHKLMEKAPPRLYTLIKTTCEGWLYYPYQNYTDALANSNREEFVKMMRTEPEYDPDNWGTDPGVLRPQYIQNKEAVQLFDEYEPLDIRKEFAKGKVHVVFERTIGPDEIYLHIASKDDQLEKLMNQLRKFYLEVDGETVNGVKVADEIKVPKLEWTCHYTIGNPSDLKYPCVVKKDGEYYRALMIQNTMSHTVRALTLIDYGYGYYDYDVKQIYLLHPDFLSPPPFSIKCELKDISIKSISHKWVTGITERMKVLIRGCKLLADYEGPSSDGFELFTIYAGNDKVSLNQRMILEGFADDEMYRRKPEPIRYEREEEVDYDSDTETVKAQLIKSSYAANVIRPEFINFEEIRKQKEEADNAKNGSCCESPDNCWCPPGDRKKEKDYFGQTWDDLDQPDDKQRKNFKYRRSSWRQPAHDCGGWSFAVGDGDNSNSVNEPLHNDWGDDEFKKTQRNQRTKTERNPSNNGFYHSGYETIKKYNEKAWKKLHGNTDKYRGVEEGKNSNSLELDNDWGVDEFKKTNSKQQNNTRSNEFSKNTFYNNSEYKNSKEAWQKSSDKSVRNWRGDEENANSLDESLNNGWGVDEFEKSKRKQNPQTMTEINEASKSSYDDYYENDKIKNGYRKCLNNSNIPSANGSSNCDVSEKIKSTIPLKYVDQSGKYINKRFREVVYKPGEPLEWKREITSEHPKEKDPHCDVARYHEKCLEYKKTFVNEEAIKNHDDTGVNNEDAFCDSDANNWEDYKLELWRNGTAKSKETQLMPNTEENIKTNDESQNDNGSSKENTGIESNNKKTNRRRKKRRGKSGNNTNINENIENNNGNCVREQVSSKGTCNTNIELLGSNGLWDVVVTDHLKEETNNVVKTEEPVVLPVKKKRQRCRKKKNVLNE